MKNSQIMEGTSSTAQSFSWFLINNKAYQMIGRNLAKFAVRLKYLNKISR